eukprot:1157234-Pelagomonas_calceolata.AAC.1
MSGMFRIRRGGLADKRQDIMQRSGVCVFNETVSMLKPCIVASLSCSLSSVISTSCLPFSQHVDAGVRTGMVGVNQGRRVRAIDVKVCNTLPVAMKVFQYSNLTRAPRKAETDCICAHPT